MELGWCSTDFQISFNCVHVYCGTVYGVVTIQESLLEKWNVCFSPVLLQKEYGSALLARPWLINYWSFSFLSIWGLFLRHLCVYFFPDVISWSTCRWLCSATCVLGCGTFAASKENCFITSIWRSFQRQREAGEWTKGTWEISALT